MYDAVIIGTGPAGLSAAINLKLYQKSFVWFGAKNYSDKVEKSEKIANYPGLGLVSGADLNARFDAHMKEMELEITDKKVTNVMPMDDRLMVLADNEVYETKTLLLATGVMTAKSYEGEEELLGRGVSYCATCDGFLYKGKTIAVFCGAERYEHEVDYLADLAEKVYLSAGYRDCRVDRPNVEKIGPIKGVKGGMKVEEIELHQGETIPVDGVFILRNAVAPGTLVPGLATEGPHITVDRMQKTNIPGVFAAGDCTGRPYQITKAVGEGNVAAHAMIEYLAETK
ncbi:MAG: NAD(P)/FAD-dependent oxidoreductase [Lachnospiraceae bacterium]|nr:NAD(P)/FAD-dependent oxidoreductase [Lachnospiraceae bacterium]